MNGASVILGYSPKIWAAGIKNVCDRGHLTICRSHTDSSLRLTIFTDKAVPFEYQRHRPLRRLQKVYPE